MDFQRTPISVLQDHCTRLCREVDYQLLSVEGHVHAPTFAYRVKVGDDITATATGPSKKKAKHSAALNALQLLAAKITSPADKNELLASIAHFVDEVQQKKVEEDNTKVTSSDNPVGKLQELCMRKRWPPPQYDKCQETGLPHERMFTMICELEHQGLSVYGNGRSKKVAKRMAAQEMLQLLEAKNLYDPNAQNNQSTKVRDNPAPLSDFLNISMDLCKDLLDNFWRDSDLECDVLEQITQKELSFYEQLDEVANLIECNIHVDDLTRCSINSKQSLCLLHLSTNDKCRVPIPVLSSYGKSDSLDAAKEDASRRALAVIAEMKVACGSQ